MKVKQTVSNERRAGCTLICCLVLSVFVIVVFVIVFIVVFVVVSVWHLVFVFCTQLTEYKVMLCECDNAIISHTISLFSTLNGLMTPLGRLETTLWRRGTDALEWIRCLGILWHLRDFNSGMLHQPPRLQCWGGIHSAPSGHPFTWSTRTERQLENRTRICR